MKNLRLSYGFALVFILMNALTFGQSIATLSMDDGDFAGHGMADNGNSYITLSSYATSSGISAVITCFSKESKTLLWSKVIKRKDMLVRMEITSESTDHLAKDSNKMRYFYIGLNVASSDLGGTDVLLLRLNGSGKVVWSRLLGSSKNDNVEALQGVDNGVLIAGETNALNAGIDPHYSFVDSSGILRWNTVPSESNDQVNADICKLHQSYYITGNNTTGGHGKDDMSFGKLNHKGELQWYKSIGTSGGEGGHDINTIDNNIYIAGVHTSVSNDGALAVLKADTTGKILWKYSYDDTGRQSIHEFGIIDNTIYAFGRTNVLGGSDFDMMVSKIGLNGSLLDHTIINGDPLKPLSGAGMIPLGSNVMISWGSFGYGTKAVNAMVELNTKLESGCQKVQGKLARKALNVSAKTQLPNVEYDVLNVKSLDISATNFTVDHYDYRCGSKPTKVTSPIDQDAEVWIKREGTILTINSLSDCNYALYDVTGRLWRQSSDQRTHHQIRCSDLPKGQIFFLVTSNKTGATHTEKVSLAF